MLIDTIVLNCTFIIQFVLGCTKQIIEKNLKKKKQKCRFKHLRNVKGVQVHINLTPLNGEWGIHDEYWTGNEGYTTDVAWGMIDTWWVLNGEWWRTRNDGNWGMRDTWWVLNGEWWKRNEDNDDGFWRRFLNIAATILILDLNWCGGTVVVVFCFSPIQTEIYDWYHWVVIYLVMDVPSFENQHQYFFNKSKLQGIV